MRQRNKFLFLGLAFFTMNTYLSAANFFPSLTPSEVQKVFDDADKSDNISFLINTSPKTVPAVQILPVSETPSTAISSGTQCIKLYNCNQGICLVGLDNKKYATNEQLLIDATSEQKDTNSCIATQHDTSSLTVMGKDTAAKAELSVPAKPIFSWTKVVNVKNDDTLNIRQSKNYKSKKLGSTVHNETCIKRYQCAGNWCEIENNQTKGWVHRKYIEKMDNNSAQSCS